MPERPKDKDTRPLWQTGGEAGASSEKEVLSLIDSFFPPQNGHAPLGRGHDCAVLRPGAPSLALSKDIFLEGAHFSRRYFRPEEVGAKALAAAASDLAAAGAVPEAFALGLILPQDLGRAALCALLRAMADEAGRLGMMLAGGDISRGPVLGLSITVWGSATDADAPFLQRREARPGDIVFLTGQVGLARVGLWALEKQGRAALEQWPEATAAHLRVLPLLDEGQILARLLRDEKAGARLSLMDVSDGLAADLPRLLEPFGADLLLPPDFIAEETHRAAPLMKLSPEECFLLGGEDYALVGTCRPELWPRLSELLPLARQLGTVREQAGLAVNGAEFSGQGFDHLRAPSEPLATQSSSSPSGRSCAQTSFSDAGPLPGRQPLPPFARGSAAALMRAGREAWQAGLMAGFNGNLSCRLSLESGLEACLITRSGAAKARLEEEDFCLLSLEDGALLAGATPSSESAVHLGIYRVCPESRAVFHAHPPRLLAISLALPPERRLDLPLPEAALYSARLAWTPFYPPGSAELGRAVAEAAKNRPAIWMERHGLVVHGPDPATALSLAEELEQLAAVRLALCAMSGYESDPAFAAVKKEP